MEEGSVTSPNGQTRLVVVVGHPRPGSRTYAVATRAASLLKAALDSGGLPVAGPDIIDLAELAPHLLNTWSGGTRSSRALDAVSRSPLLLVASPTFRGAYSGLLKLFLDLLPRDGLESSVVVPLMTAGLAAHRGCLESTLRPVLIELRAEVPAAGISVLETELAGFDEVFGAWWAANGRVVRSAIRDRAWRYREEVTPC